ncbi:MAG: tetraacyldisaccharide 4'-kinase [Parachlamydiaceae bacterium]|nr:tetraacyldisaccharide 4'-kinase [Parachlamydiaceae bacterium]
MKLKNIESYFVEVMKRQRPGISAKILRGFLLLVSFFFQWFSICRNWCFDHGWFRCHCPPVPLVISIGNIVTGGTGKTPATLLLAKEFHGTFPLAILSRGYRSKAENQKEPTFLCSSRGPLYPASYCGDEPFLLAQNLPEALIFVGKNRHKTSVMASKAGAKLIILDDGMQHRRLSRDLDIVVMDATDLFGQGHFLPRGFLRESIGSLSRANLIILNHIETSEQFATAKAQVSCYSKAPVIGARLHVSNIFDFKGEKIETLVNKKVGIFCGIANPEYFAQSVENQGAKIMGKCTISDHCTFEPLALDKFANYCKGLGAELLLCTEKDRVKFGETLNLALPVAWLQVELSIVEGAEVWQTFLNRAKSDILRRM